MPKTTVDLDDELNKEVVIRQLDKKERSKPNYLLRLIRLGLQKEKELEKQKQAKN